MADNDTLKLVADKITRIRNDRGLTQQEVADVLKIPRTSYTQVEQGNRNLSTMELVKLGEALRFSVPKFLTEVFGISSSLDDVKPVFNYRRFRSVLLYILHKCKGKENFGKVVLYKLLYFADFNYYEKYGEFLTGATYSKLPMGPVPAVEHYINELVDLGEIKKEEIPIHQWTLIKYSPNVRPDMKELSSPDVQLIDAVLEKYSDMTAKKISELSHEDVPWLQTENLYDEINYALVLERPAGHNF